VGGEANGCGLHELATIQVHGVLLTDSESTPHGHLVDVLIFFLDG
jgi:hypothetical protein